MNFEIPKVLIFSFSNIRYTKFIGAAVDNFKKLFLSSKINIFSCFVCFNSRFSKRITKFYLFVESLNR